mmetsp:Transcript_125018/g.176445  ORF Transcript_125018/g.176445 Transcript_125018/m.176445 type:complete len:259 (-) Transcript_125018:26-802(-)
MKFFIAAAMLLCLAVSAQGLSLARPPNLKACQRRCPTDCAFTKLLAVEEKVRGHIYTKDHYGECKRACTGRKDISYRCVQKCLLGPCTSSCKNQCQKRYDQFHSCEGKRGRCSASCRWRNGMIRAGSAMAREDPIARRDRIRNKCKTECAARHPCGKKPKPPTPPLVPPVKLCRKRVPCPRKPYTYCPPGRRLKCQRGHRACLREGRNFCKSDMWVDECNKEEVDYCRKEYGCRMVRRKCYKRYRRQGRRACYKSYKC